MRRHLISPLGRLDSSPLSLILNQTLEKGMIVTDKLAIRKLKRALDLLGATEKCYKVARDMSNLEELLGIPASVASNERVSLIHETIRTLRETNKILQFVKNSSNWKN